MTHIQTRVGRCTAMTLTYDPKRHDDEINLTYPASVWVTLENKRAGRSTLFLDMEHVRQLAEELPALLMAHDAAEHAESVVKAAAEIDSAHKAA